jgi:hypothetical protein
MLRVKILQKETTLIIFIAVMSLLSVSCAPKGHGMQRGNLPQFEFRLAEEQAAEGTTEAVVVDSGEKLYLHKETILTNEDI